MHAGVLKARWQKRLNGQHKASGMPDMVDRVMDAIPRNEWGPAAWTQLCFEIKTFLLAGHETSAAMLTFALFELTQNCNTLSQGMTSDRIQSTQCSTLQDKPEHSFPYSMLQA
jgi:cytochrome P450